ncbi:nuclear transport factor 2 family protein [Streptomyces sp. AK08-02]|uniref:nuclear transport factor 2 family protein n=1 Tax=Streptomyces sp. AK08-02 TaxID=3028654 RepID=UPI0029BCD2B1|nr:nuclear transport factor 2 family protein [Streptomyces sp. AK08-02]MDX3745009.1 nuclear transport factor 2 family protein [Streptomyces sp. AK08-02]
MTDLTELTPPHPLSTPTDPGDAVPGDPTGPSNGPGTPEATHPVDEHAPARSQGFAVAGPPYAVPTDDGHDLRDRMDLRQLVDTYAHALDRRMTELFASLFGEGGELVLMRPPGSLRAPLVLDGRDGWAKALAVLEPCRVTTHFVGNHLVRLAGDSATGETYCLAHEIHPVDGVDRIRVRSIRYHDSYRRTNGSWLFARRELTIDWTEDRALRSASGT